ncbi:hypothetical protein IMSAG249_02256 [Lachnospiraceae bacterium]|nr:hypothetical protein IMSAG249_02256 [Lachnospiraceae bacterium]
MMTVWKIFGLLLWLVAVPFCMGLVVMPCLKRKLRTPGTALVSGYILMFTLLELIGIPVVLLVVYNGFTIFIKCFTPVIILFALLGVLTVRWMGKNGHRLNFSMTSAIWDTSLEEKIMWLMFIGLVGFQLYMAFTRASFDGDDAYYGVQGVIAQQVDTLYRVNPYTGRSAALDVRHALALFPIWEAYVGSMSGVHATIVSHSFVPLVLIPMTYILYYQIGKELFWKKKESLPMFMALMAFWQMFGYVSLFTTETFFLTRTWQGKSFAGNFVIPAVIWIFLSNAEPSKEGDGLGRIKYGEVRRASDIYGGVEEKSKNTGLWLLLACLNFAGGASSSLAILLSCLMTAGFGLLFAFRERSFAVLVRAGLACIPGGLYVLLYVALTHGLLVLPV